MGEFICQNLEEHISFIKKAPLTNPPHPYTLKLVIKSWAGAHTNLPTPARWFAFKSG